MQLQGTSQALLSCAPCHAPARPAHVRAGRKLWRSAQASPLPVQTLTWSQPKASTRLPPLQSSALETGEPVAAQHPSQQSQEQAGSELRRQPARLVTKLIQAHAASVTAAFVLKDTAEEKLVVSSSLDKNLCTWTLKTCKQPVPAGTPQDAPPPPPLVDANGHPKLEIQVIRLTAPRAPVFSIVRQPRPAPNGSVFSANADVLFCGNAAKEMFAWEVKPCPPNDPCPANFQMVATEYSGWVRSLAITGKWLISCGCNCLRQHDTSFPLPKEVSNVEQAFKGDILTIAAGSNRVFAGCADGCLRSWALNNKNGQLTLGPEAKGAHSSRITALTLHGQHLYSVSLDGCVRVWNAQNLVCLGEVRAAHGGQKIHAVAMGPDNVLYTGGDDKLIRRWQPLSSHPDFVQAVQKPPPSAVAPSTSVDETTGQVTSTLDASGSDSDDSADCDLGGPLNVSRESSPMDANSAAAAAAHSQQASSSSSSNSSNSSGGGASRIGGGLASATASSNGDGKGEQARVFELHVAAPPLSAHSSGLRCLTVGSAETLVSGDSNGDICIWCVSAGSGGKRAADQ